ncbi:Hypp3275 [Branchiostoma lanceolatum]|uniref:Hypp3275 protein n=1 Tax=Branchiostoma lanceolatum TaxID=7740 RepID=A0A8K0A1D3_BRALA|nr:Hypp3275 [Branchiostoma lanceolatum]
MSSGDDTNMTFTIVDDVARTTRTYGNMTSTSTGQAQTEIEVVLLFFILMFVIVMASVGVSSACNKLARHLDDRKRRARIKPQDTEDSYFDSKEDAEDRRHLEEDVPTDKGMYKKENVYIVTRSSPTDGKKQTVIDVVPLSSPGSSCGNSVYGEAKVFSRTSLNPDVRFHSSSC